MTSVAEPVAPSRRARIGIIGLVAAETFGALGGRMTFLAIPWLVLVTTGSPVKVGLVTGAETLPYVLSGVLAAPLQDRFGPRLTSILADVASVGAMAAIALSASLDFRVLMVLVAIAGILRAQADRSKNNLLVPLMNAAGTNFLRVSAVREGVLKSANLLGASLAGITIVAFGAVGAIWFDAATFAVAALLVSVIVPPPAPPAEGEPVKEKPEPYLTALRNGVGHFKGDRLVRAVTNMLFFTNLFNQALAVVFVPMWVLTVLDSPAALGSVSASYAIGMILGNIVFAWLAPFLPRYPVLVAGYFIGGAPRFLVIALTDNLAVVVAVTFISGFAMCSVNPTIGAMIYQRIPSNMLARVGGIIAAVAFAGIPLGGLIGGVFVQTFGLTNGVLLATAIYFVVSLAPLAGYRIWRELNDAAPKRPTADGITALPQLYAVTGVATGPRVTLRYAAGEWTLRARHGLKTLISRQPVSPKVAISALTQVDVAPVQAAVREVLEHDRMLTERQARRLRLEQARTEATLADLRLALTRD